jgi:ribonuclease J
MIHSNQPKSTPNPKSKNLRNRPDKEGRNKKSGYPSNRGQQQPGAKTSRGKGHRPERGFHDTPASSRRRSKRPAAEAIRSDIGKSPLPISNKLRIIPLGGVGSMGKNVMVVEYGEDILVLDCGSSFPDESMLGIDLVLPDVTYLEQNHKRVRGIVITHGHEDHIGAVPYIAPKLGVPVFAPPLAAAIINNKLEEFTNARNVKVATYQADDKLRLGVFTVSFCRINHSIPDAFTIFVDTPEGRLIYTGDFKFDPTPPDGISAEYDKLIATGKNHPLLLMSESTNAHTPGRTPSEQIIADAFMEIFAHTKGRLIVASFASRIDRMQHVMAAAIKYHRKVAITGRSMLKNLEAATNLGYIKYPKDLIVPLESLKKLKDHEVVILSTGNQGQEGSALVRMAYGEHRQIKLKQGDTVVISSSPIPGNERSVSAIINNLYRAGAEVIFDKNMQIHVTGHAYQEEMMQMIEMTNPRYFIPIHGEYHMLVANKGLAEKVGVKKENIIIIEDGNVVEFSEGRGVKTDKKVPVGAVLVDGLGVGDVKEIVLHDRQTMAKEGVLTIIVVVDNRGRLIGNPDIISRGFVYMREKGDLINQTRDYVKKLFTKNVTKLPDDWSHIKNTLRESVSEYLFRETERRPLVLPVIIEV